MLKKFSKQMLQELFDQLVLLHSISILFQATAPFTEWIILKLVKMQKKVAGTEEPREIGTRRCI
jgi:hypothetical protein